MPSSSFEPGRSLTEASRNGVSIERSDSIVAGCGVPSDSEGLGAGDRPAEEGRPGGDDRPDEGGGLDDGTVAGWGSDATGAMPIAGWGGSLELPLDTGSRPAGGTNVGGSGMSFATGGDAASAEGEAGGMPPVGDRLPGVLGSKLGGANPPELDELLAVGASPVAGPAAAGGIVGAGTVGGSVVAVAGGTAGTVVVGVGSSEGGATPEATGADGGANPEGALDGGSSAGVGVPVSLRPPADAEVGGAVVAACGGSVSGVGGSAIGGSVEGGSATDGSGSVPTASRTGESVGDVGSRGASPSGGVAPEESSSVVGRGIGAGRSLDGSLRRFLSATSADLASDLEAFCSATSDGGRADSPRGHRSAAAPPPPAATVSTATAIFVCIADQVTGSLGRRRLPGESGSVFWC